MSIVEAKLTYNRLVKQGSSVFFRWRAIVEMKKFEKRLLRYFLMSHVVPVVMTSWKKFWWMKKVERLQKEEYNAKRMRSVLTAWLDVVVDEAQQKVERLKRPAKAAPFVKPALASIPQPSFMLANVPPILSPPLENNDLPGCAEAISSTESGGPSPESAGVRARVSVVTIESSDGPESCPSPTLRAGGSEKQVCAESIGSRISVAGTIPSARKESGEDGEYKVVTRKRGASRGGGESKAAPAVPSQSYDSEYTVCRAKSRPPTIPAPQPSSKNTAGNFSVEKMPYHTEANCWGSGEAVDTFCEALKKQMKKYAYVEQLWFDCLDLSWASHGVEELTKVFSLLASRKIGIKRLKLFQAKITDDEALVVQKFLLSINQSLTELHVSHGRLTHKGMDHLLKALRYHQTAQKAPHVVWFRFEHNPSIDKNYLKNLIDKKDICVVDQKRCPERFTCCQGAWIHAPTAKTN